MKCEFFAYLYVPAQTDAFTDQLAAVFCFSLLSNSLFVVKSTKFGYFYFQLLLSVACSALTLLFGRQEEHSACKNWQGSYVPGKLENVGILFVRESREMINYVES